MKKEFGKSDLQTGDIIVDRNGIPALVLLEQNIYIFSENGYDDLDNIREDLTGDGDETDIDIMQVYRGHAGSPICFSDYEEGDLLFEREDDLEEDDDAGEEIARAPERSDEEPVKEVCKRNLIRVIMQAFYGNRTATEVTEEDVDKQILGYIGDELKPTEPIDRTIVPIPGYDNLVLLYNKYQEEKALKQNREWLERDGYEAKPLAFIPEQNIEIYSRCLVCRMEDGKLASLRREDFEPGFMKYLAK